MPMPMENPRMSCEIVPLHAESAQRLANLRRRMAPGGAPPALRAQLEGRLLDELLALLSEAETRLEAQEERLQELETMAHTDCLTGLLNRRGFDAAARRELARAGREGGAGLLLAIDLDGFKQVNDTHGHAAGDAVLSRLAEALRAATRDMDLVARLGGDEFALLIPCAKAAADSGFAESFRRRLEGLELCWHGRRIPLRLSLGAAAYHGETDPALLLDAADRALYALKNRRRVG
jgi:diguanylate cyclase (GGDEF)-like protein